MKCGVCGNESNIVVKATIYDKNFAPESVQKSVEICKACLAKA